MNNVEHQYMLLISIIERFANALSRCEEYNAYSYHCDYCKFDRLQFVNSMLDLWDTLELGSYKQPLLNKLQELDIINE